MEPVMRLRIPRTDYSRIRILLDLSDDDFQKLLEAMDEVPRTLSLLEFEDKVTARSQLPSKVVASIINLVIPLYGVQASTDISTPRLVDAIYEAIVATDEPDLQLLDNDWEPFKAHLSQLLSLSDTLGLLAKATRLSADYERTMHSAKIVTDIRPVFHADPSEPVAAAIVTHNLQLTYHEGRTLKEFYVALDDDDLALFRRLITRAEAKSRNLREVLREANIPLTEEGID